MTRKLVFSRMVAKYCIRTLTRQSGIHYNFFFTSADLLNRWIRLLCYYNRVFILYPLNKHITPNV